MEKNINEVEIWKKISSELNSKYPTLSKYLNSKYSHLLKECFYKVFDSDDVSHMLWVIQMDNDVSKETINTIQEMFTSKIKKIKTIPTNKPQEKKILQTQVKQTISNNKLSLPKTKIGINRFILAWFVVLGFYFLTYILMIRPIPKDSNQVVFMLFGTISTGFGTVLGYFFGSSQSSQEKDDIIKNKKNT